MMTSLANKLDAVELGTEKHHCDFHGDYQSVGRKLLGRDLWSLCKKCEEANRQKEVEKKKQETELREKIRKEKFLANAGIIKRYWHLTLGEFNPTDSQAHAYKVARSFVDRFDEMAEKGQTVVFCGTIGTGKTRLVSAIIQSLGKGRYIRAVDISRTVRSTYTNNGQTEQDAIQSFVDPDLLVIDEAGLQQGTENEAMLISDVIDRRYGDMKPTIICSNLNEGELATVFGERAWDRLKQNCIICPVVGESLR